MNLPVTFTQKLRKDGSIVIPAYLIKELDLQTGIPLQLTIDQKGGK